MPEKVLGRTFEKYISLLSLGGLWGTLDLLACLWLRAGAAEGMDEVESCPEPLFAASHGTEVGIHLALPLFSAEESVGGRGLAGCAGKAGFDFESMQGFKRDRGGER